MAEENKEKYCQPQSFIHEYLPALDGMGQYCFGSTIVVPDVDLVEGGSDKDSENAKRLFEAFRGHLNRTQATDRRMWAYMTHDTFWGYIGIACALCFANIGAAYGTAKSGVGILTMGISKPEIIIKSVIPVIMAGILGIYGLIVAVILKQNIKQESYTMFDGWKHLASGLCCGLSSLGAGIAIGIAGNAGVRALGQQERLFVGMMLILIFSEALGLYGLIVSLILSSA